MEIGVSRLNVCGSVAIPRNVFRVRIISSSFDSTVVSGLKLITLSISQINVRNWVGPQYGFSCSDLVKASFTGAIILS